MSCLNCKYKKLCSAEFMMCNNINVCFRCKKVKSCTKLCNDMIEYLHITANTKNKCEEIKVRDIKNIDNMHNPEYLFYKRYKFNIKDIPLDALSPRDRELLIAHIMENITYTQICNIFGDNKSSIKKIIDNSLKKLKKFYFMKKVLEKKKHLLTKIQYEYMNLYYNYGLPIGEISKTKNKSLISIKNILRKARNKLEGYVKDASS